MKVKLALYLTHYHGPKTYPLLKHHAMKTYWGNGGIIPCIINHGTRWR